MQCQLVHMYGSRAAHWIEVCATWNNVVTTLDVRQNLECCASC